MKKEQFIQKHRNLNIAQSELDRKWRVLKEEEEMQRLIESMQSYQANATAMGGGGITLFERQIVPDNDLYYTFSSLFTEIVPNNDIYYTFS